MLVGTWRNWNPHMLLMGMGSDASAGENSVAVPPCVKHSMTT